MKTTHLPNTLGGYGINRAVKSVSFGCGEVRIKKTDLLILKKIVEEEQKFKADKARILRLIGGRIDSNSYNYITPELIDQVLGI